MRSLYLNDRTKKFAAEFTRRAKAVNLEHTQAGKFDAATYDIVQYYARAMKEAKVTGDPKRRPRSSCLRATPRE